MKRILGLSAAAVAVACLYAGAGVAGLPRAAREYIVDHEILGEVGLHRYEFERNGEEFEVKTTVRLKAKVLFVTIRYYTADRREVWRDGRLVAYDSHTDDDGTVIEVKARAEGGKLVVEGADGRFEAPADVPVASPWRLDNLTRPLVLDVEKGGLRKVSTKAAGEEVIEAGGEEVKATRYVMTGDIEREFWFDAEGNWLKLRYLRDGDEIVVTLQ